VDIRHPIGLEMEYDVLESGHVVIPHFSVHNMSGLELLSVVETDPEWRGRQRPAGRYVTIGWIPGNYLAEGTLSVGAAASTIDPHNRHFWARDAVVFCVIDSFDGDAARGDYQGSLRGVVRPMLKWNTRFSENGAKPTETDCSTERVAHRGGAEGAKGT
jgi:lipopolysaccharide transport system ATP-binding protein